VDPTLPESHDQNTVVTRAATAAAGAFALGGYATIYDGVVGPWFLPTFAATTHLEHLDYVILSRRWTGARLVERHLLRDSPENPAEVAALIESARAASRLTHTTR
jgi:hypothetical protein